jgi:hypothetical protein
MAAAFVHNSSLLHDHEQRKKIQPEGKESRRQVGQSVVTDYQSKVTHVEHA